MTTAVAVPSGRVSVRRIGVLDKRLLVGGTLLSLIVLAAVIGPVIYGADTLALHLDHRLAGPSASFPLGTDELGRDLLARILVGLRPALLSGLAAVGVAAIAGTVVGLSAGFIGGIYETIAMRIVDLLLAWPSIFLALGIVLLVGPGPLVVVVAIGLGETPVFARVIRSVTIGQLHSEHVQAARSMGASRVRIMRRHIFPFARTPLIVQLAIAAPVAVISEASLSFLGLGTQPPRPSLGSTLSAAQDYLANSPTYTIFPAATIVVLVLSLTLLADGLQDALDPRHQRRTPTAAPAPLGPPTDRQVAAPRSDLLAVDGLTVEFPSVAGGAVAVDRVPFTVGRGETVAIVGESGSGKSITSLATMRLTPHGSRATADTMTLEDLDLVSLSEHGMRDIRGCRIAMIFQNPMSSLNPVLTIGRQITEALEEHLDMKPSAARTRALELLGLVEVAAPERVIRSYPHQLSGGMRQRVMIAMALAGNPDLLIADEPTTALDVTVQAQILELLARLQDTTGMAILLITHDLGVIAGVADRVYVMYGGRVMEYGTVDDVLTNPLHPYTQGLVRTVRQLGDAEVTRLVPIPGHPPSIGPRLVGCPFAPRCPHVTDRCRNETPALRSMGEQRGAACHLAPIEIAAP